MEIPGYKIKREIGKGGMATVYLATQESLERSVVLKILDSVNVKKSEDLVERFLAEGRIIASFNHPNIITIYDIGITDNNSLFISMEYVNGGDLKQRLELSISSAQALDYLSQIASALSEAHKHGIVHRDVKPANILFKDNTPILSDFGIAKQVDVDADLTSTGIFLGSPNYVSPEQADGLKLDGRADIYSLGCIFYEMLTGEKPYKSDSVIGIVIQHQQAPIPVLPAELALYQPLLNKMMAKKREQRFPDAESLITEIKKLQQKDRMKSVIAQLDPTGEHLSATGELRVKREKKVLLGLILFGLIMFSSLQYVEIRIKSPSAQPAQASTATVLDKNPVEITAAANPATKTETPATVSPATQQTQNSAPAPTAQQPPVTEEITRALKFLGNQCLEDYKLTYPPKDNAYYYFSRLLEIDPGDKEAVKGIMEIADRYSFLAEQAMLKNQYKKSSAYIDIGLRINPKNEALLSLKNLVKSQNTSLWDTFKSLFSKNK